MDQFFRALPGVFDAIESSEDARRAFVFAAWRRVAGGQIAERTTAVTFDENRLTVAVADKTWQRNLESLASQLLFRLNDSLGKNLVEFIEFQIDSAAIADHVLKTENRDEQDFLNRLAPEIKAAALAIKDAELRRTFMLAAGNCLSRAEARALARA